MKHVKWICLFAVVIGIAFFAYQKSNSQTDVEMHRGINIGNALDSPRYEYWGVSICDEFFYEIAQAGFDTVRLPVRFSDYVDRSNDYKLDEDFMIELDGYIDYALSLDLIIVLDFHHFLSLMESASDDDVALYYSVWTQLSERYQDYPDELVFELLNEPNNAVTTQLWNEMIANSLEIIRQTNETRSVILCAPDWSHVYALKLLDIPDDDNIIVSFHYYSPMEVTFQNNINHDYVTGEEVPWTGTEEELAVMENDFLVAYEFGIENDVEIFLGEFGVVKDAPEEYREAWTSAVVSFADKYGFAYTYWELCSDFGIYDASTNTWNEELLNALLPEKE